jgi:hypothetical protein
MCVCVRTQGWRSRASLPSPRGFPLVSRPSTAAYRLGNHGLGPSGGGGYCLGSSY